MAKADLEGTLTAEQVRQAFDYDPETGILTWRWRWGVSHHINKRCAGTPAGWTHRKSTGHMKVIVNGRSYFYHRLVWLHATGAWPANDIDHIDGNPANNRLSNLRDATKSQNSMNSRNVKGKTAPKGARFHKGTGRWQASILVRGKSHYLGLFPTAEAAHEAYCAAAAKLHGAFARTG